MKLLELKELVDQAVENAGKTAPYADVEVWFKKKMYRITRVSQFGVVPNVSIELREKVINLDEEDGYC